MTLEFHEFKDGNAPILVKRRTGVTGEERLNRRGRVVEHHADVVVACYPRVVEQAPPQPLELDGEGVTEPIKGGAQGCAPVLPPARRAAVAPTIGTPAT